MKYFLTLALLALVGVAAVTSDAKVPRYAHILVVMEENKDYGQIVGSADAPTITALGRTYGYATNFFAESHPSEPNYVALVGGSTYGIRDDDAYYCKPRVARPDCSDADKPNYPDHTIYGPSLATQLEAAGLSWKNYNESIPKPGSTDIQTGTYAVKHTGFMNFASVQN